MGRDPAMDFIEQIFGISPDGGDGSTEVIYVVAFVLVLALARWRRMVWWLVVRALTR
jgi:hypothetical protein